MNNFMSIDKLKEKVNYALIMFRTNFEAGHRCRDANLMLKRLAKIASVIPNGEFVGVELCFLGMKLTQNHLFFSKNAGVEGTDCEWIVEPAEVKSAAISEENSNDRIFAGREVYIISMDPYERIIDPNKVSEYFEYNDGPWDDIREVNVENAVMVLSQNSEIYFRYYVFSKDNNSVGGFILASFPEATSLKEKAAYMMAFPFHRLTKLEEIGSLGEIKPFTEEYWRASLAYLVARQIELFSHSKFTPSEENWESIFEEAEQEIIVSDEDDKEKHESKDSDEFIEDDVDDLFGFTLNDDDDENNDDKPNENPDDKPKDADIESQPIDILELSVRPLNSLRRSSITTVGQLLKMDEDELMKVKNLGRKCVEEIMEKLAPYLPPVEESPEPEPEPEHKKETDYYAKLEELIGLEDAKAQVKRIAAFARMKKYMKSLGRNDIPMVLHMEFKGNPGTAKTTVARILAGILYQIGILKNKNILEVGRADLIAKYVGQTAIKVKDVFERAKGRLLFIDEAYSLTNTTYNGYEDEAVSTIVQEMENLRDEVVVVFAGYPKEMEVFFEMNPGLRSRVPFTLEFKDYSVEEMAEICKLEAKKRGFEIHEQAMDRVAEACAAAKTQKDSGNGRFCRNLIDKAVLNFASRSFSEDETQESSPDEAQPEIETVLIGEDFSEAQTAPKKVNKSPIGFRTEE